MTNEQIAARVQNGVWCPVCHVAPGQWCLGLGWPHQGLHEERLNAAKAQKII